jgi:Winged helix DNA-binding domain
MHHIPSYRLHYQQISAPVHQSPSDLAGYMGAMQAQDYTMSKWAVGTRLPGLTDTEVVAALDTGALVRTHVLRPTWHIVAGRDVRWMLALTGPRIKASLAAYDRGLGIDAALYARANALIVKALEGGNHLTREEVMDAIKQGGVATDSSRAVHFMMNAEVEGLICNGIMRGNTQTYALLDEKVPPAPVLAREEALVELARRYFRSHAPATLADYQWWSGLSMPDARAGLEAIKSTLDAFESHGQTYYLPAHSVAPASVPSVYFLPAFDEYCVSYKDRKAVFDPAWQGLAITSNGIFKPIIVVNGMVTGIWKRTVTKTRMVIDPTFFDPHQVPPSAALEEAANLVGRFWGMDVVLSAL